MTGVQTCALPILANGFDVVPVGPDYEGAGQVDFGYGFDEILIARQGQVRQRDDGVHTALERRDGRFRGVNRRRAGCSTFELSGDEEMAPAPGIAPSSAD